MLSIPFPFDIYVDPAAFRSQLNFSLRKRDLTIQLSLLPLSPFDRYDFHHTWFSRSRRRSRQKGNEIHVTQLRDPKKKTCVYLLRACAAGSRVKCQLLAFSRSERRQREGDRGKEERTRDGLGGWIHEEDRKKPVFDPIFPSDNGERSKKTQLKEKSVVNAGLRVGFAPRPDGIVLRRPPDESRISQTRSATFPICIVTFVKASRRERQTNVANLNCKIGNNIVRTILGDSRGPAGFKASSLFRGVIL